MSLLNFNKKKAEKFLAQGLALDNAGKSNEAIESYLKAAELDPDSSSSLYNIGLIYKYQNNWNKSLKYNQRAYQLNPQDEATRWNLAIAATALRQWDIARSMWKDNGLTLSGETGPIEMNFGITPVRLNPDDDGEVVWATRIDPVRAKIDSIPYRESGYHYGDIVLHDGAATGYRKIGEREYPVFNVLELFAVSDFSTLIASVNIESDEDLEILEKLFQETPNKFEDWSKNVRMLCKQCSEGIPHENHDTKLELNWNGERTLGIAVRKDLSVQKIFDQWQNSSNGKLISIT